MNSTNIKKLILIFLTAFLSPVSCFHSISDICKKDLLQTNREIDDALVEITQLEDSIHSGRVPATTTVDLKRKEWSVDHLKLSQRYMDSVGVSPTSREFRQQMSDIADGWVLLFGYVQIGDRAGIKKTLKMLRERHTQAQSSACSIESN